MENKYYSRHTYTFENEPEHSELENSEIKVQGPDHVKVERGLVSN